MTSCPPSQSSCPRARSIQERCSNQRRSGSSSRSATAAASTWRARPRHITTPASSDALKLLLKLPDASLDAAYLLYPDPWPKTRHHKRRFVSPTTLGELARVLKPGAIFRFATDIEDYANWTLAHMLREPRFRFIGTSPAEWHTPYPGWEPTRYEQKARLEGRHVSFYFQFERLA